MLRRVRRRVLVATALGGVAAALAFGAWGSARLGQSVEIRNDTGEPVYASLFAVTFPRAAGVHIEPHASATLDFAGPCIIGREGSNLDVSRSGGDSIGHCPWDVARQHEPLVVTVHGMSCQTEPPASFP